MRVEKLMLEDYRGFGGKHTIVFPAGKLAVLVGENGAGKTAVLEALASLLTAVPSLLRGTNVAWPFRDESNVHAGAESSICAIVVDHQCRQLGWGLTEHLGERPSDLPEPPSSSVHRAMSSLSELGNDLTNPDTLLPIVSFIHSGSTRTPLAHIEKEDGPALGHPRLAAFDGAFDPEDLQFDALESWFEAQENLENEHRLRKNNLSFRLPTLKAVRGAVTRFLSELQAHNLHDLHVVRAQVDGPLGPVKGRLAIHKGENTLFLDQLSEGERRLVLLVGDVARRLAIANPDSPEPLHGPGIVLVDEIDLHLHPRWQRRVIPSLTATFPGLQLILTTHAPAVLSTVPNESLVVLHDGHVIEGTHRVKDRDSNGILADLMGVPERPEGVTARLQELYTAIDTSPRKARQLLKKLEAELGPDDAELLRARTVLELTA